MALAVSEESHKANAASSANNTSFRMNVHAFLVINLTAGSEYSPEAQFDTLLLFP